MIQLIIPSAANPQIAVVPARLMNTPVAGRRCEPSVNSVCGGNRCNVGMFC